MLNIPPALLTQFEIFLQGKAIPKPEPSAYIKWLRYYLDFCQQYHFPPAHQESLPHFLHKLQEKKQTRAQQQQASQAISLYYEMMRRKEAQEQRSAPVPLRPGVPAQKAPHPPTIPQPSQQTASAAKLGKPATGVSWVAVYHKLANEIQVRHYSRKTLKIYMHWLRRLQTFTRSKDPEWLSSGDVKEFLTFLAVTRKVAASTQNQAFNALLFLYRHILNREFGRLEGVVRAKRKPYVPVVLSREEIQALLQHLPPPYDLAL